MYEHMSILGWVWGGSVVRRGWAAAEMNVYIMIEIDRAVRSLEETYVWGYRVIIIKYV